MREQGVYLVHVMKTGGTSMNRLLHDHFGLDRSYPTATDPKLRRNQKFAPRHLLELTPQERARFSFVSMHAGAWVADALFPEHLSVTVLRDPVDRTISHLRQLAELPQTPADPEAIYHDPSWHPRLVNHQTQVFAATEAEYRAQDTYQPEYDLTRLPEAERGPVREQFWAAFTTTIGVAKTIDEQGYREAEARLDRIDEVGVTERLPDLVTRIRARLGAALPAVGRDNVSADQAPIPASLRARIEDDNQWDRRLYERARERSAD